MLGPCASRKRRGLWGRLVSRAPSFLSSCSGSGLRDQPACAAFVSVGYPPVLLGPPPLVCSLHCCSTPAGQVHHGPAFGLRAILNFITAIGELHRRGGDP